jgi:hypothetical protein
MPSPLGAGRRVSRRNWPSPWSPHESQYQLHSRLLPRLQGFHRIPNPNPTRQQRGRLTLIWRLRLEIARRLIGAGPKGYNVRVRKQRLEAYREPSTGIVAKESYVKARGGFFYGDWSEVMPEVAE